MPLRHLTTRGQCLLAAGLAAAASSLLLDERDLLRAAAFIIALPLLAALLARYARAGVTVRRRLLPPRVAAGDTAQVELELCSRNGSGTRGLVVHDELPPELGAGPALSGGKTLRYRLRPGQRGVHPIGPARARLTDPFGLAEFDRQLAGQERLVVTPEVVALTGRPPGIGADSDRRSALGQRSGQDPDDVAVRGYRQGDDLRKVHWRSTARRDELMVRVDEQPTPGCVQVLLDHRATAHRGTGAQSSLECAISLVASICQHLRHREQQVRASTTTGQVLTNRARPGRRTETELLDNLAALTPAGEVDLDAGPAVGRHDLIAVLGALTPADAEHLVAGRPRGTRSAAVLLDVDEWGADGTLPASDPAAAGRVLAAGGWSVVVARPDQPLSTVWTRLCAGTRVRAGVL